VTLAKFHTGVVRGDVTQRIRQDPIIVGRSAYRASVDRENDAAAVTKQPSMITDDTQPKGHVSQIDPACKKGRTFRPHTLTFHAGTGRADI
jgi:hypothetical protein